jgi:hypothetical protein
MSLAGLRVRSARHASRTAGSTGSKRLYTSNQTGCRDTGATLAWPAGDGGVCAQPARPAVAQRVHLPDGAKCQAP